jgi:hypothetical protein
MPVEELEEACAVRLVVVAVQPEMDAPGLRSDEFVPLRAREIRLPASGLADDHEHSRFVGVRSRNPGSLARAHHFELRLRCVSAEDVYLPTRKWIWVVAALTEVVPYRVLAGSIDVCDTGINPLDKRYCMPNRVDSCDAKQLFVLLADH